MVYDTILLVLFDDYDELDHKYIMCSTGFMM